MAFALAAWSGALAGAPRVTNSMNAVDTNVLIYSADSDEQEKGPVAVALLNRLATDPTPAVLPWQVLCEFTAFIAKARLRDTAGAQGESNAFEYVRAIRDRCRLVLRSPAASDLAIDIHLRDQVSIWDAMLLAACVEAGVTQLFTEDMQSRPTIRGVRIVNPFM
jgi:predicted nucleic acid-binding protein